MAHTTPTSPPPAAPRSRHRKEPPLRSTAAIPGRLGRGPCATLLGIAIGCSLFGGAARADAGLQGEYYNTKNPAALGTPGDFSRVDGTVDFDWLGDAPDGTTLIADDQYSARWSGFVYVDQAGSWTFKTVSNDGVRLWINGVKLVDAWTQHAAQEDSGSLSLPGPGWYPILLEHFNDGGTATIELRFEGPGQTDVVIPSSDLSTTYPGGTPPTAEAGPVQVTPLGSDFTLNGAVSGGLSGIFALWTQVDGPPATIHSPGSALTEVSPSATGLLTFQLLAFDGVGGYGADQVSVYVTDPSQQGTVTGTLRKWYPLTVDFTHSTTLDEGTGTNPFLDFRLQVHFIHRATGTIYNVPGYFAADGDAANTLAIKGKTWRARFAPDFAGTWDYVAFFQTGTDVSISLSQVAGTPTSFDGATGSFFVQAVNPTAPGFFGQGRLEYKGGHHYVFAQNAKPFLKTGTDSPENFLGYYEFDGTVDYGGQPNDLDLSSYGDGLHHFDPHLADYSALGGGPTWMGGKGKRIIGALNYLASVGINSVYTLTYNTDGGDGQEVFPWVTPSQKLRFDVSKLDQWALVFDHMQTLGIHEHIVLQEVENEAVLDGGSLGRERMLYYRELVARLGHALALTWNIGEEYGGSNANVEAFATYIRALDPVEHPIKVHTSPDQIDSVYDPLLGDPVFEGASLQMDASETVTRTQQLRGDSNAAGQPWVVEYDEQNPANVGLQPDAVDPNHDDLRRDALWGNFLAGGGGVEWYFGYGFADDDLDCEDFRSRANMWDQSRAARELFEDELLFASMDPEDSLASATDAQVLALKGEAYAVFRPQGGSSTLDLEASGDTFSVEWFDGKLGGAPRTGSVTSVTGPGPKNIGTPPAGGLDWVALVKRADNRPPQIYGFAAEPSPFAGNADLSFGVQVTDPDGLGDIASAVAHVWTPGLIYLGAVPLTDVGGGTWAAHFPNLPPLLSGNWWFLVLVTDTQGQGTLQIGSLLAQ